MTEREYKVSRIYRESSPRENKVTRKISVYSKPIAGFKYSCNCLQQSINIRYRYAIEIIYMYGSSSPLRAELSAMYGAEFSATGRAVHGPSCPRAELSGELDPYMQIILTRFVVLYVNGKWKYFVLRINSDDEYGHVFFN